MTVKKLEANTYEFNFEGGGPEKIVINGIYQPGLRGTMLSVSPVGSNWNVERKQDGHKLLIAIWTLNKDGTLLTDDFTSFDQNGTPSNVKLLYTRTTTGSGFTGTWVSQSAAIGLRTILEIRAYKSNGLTLTIPAEQATLNLIFDGKTVRRINARTFDITRSNNGKITQTQEYLVSPDLKTLTRTQRVVGENQPLITVFERQ
jgi:hypothetical protein